MKTIYIIISLFSTVTFFAQERKHFTCDEIKKVIDYNIYDTLSNGKLIARLDKAVNKRIYKIVFNNEFKYVTKPVMKKIKKSIKINHCKDILIQKIDRVNNSEIKIIRD
jgi:hypothetical protein